MIIQCGYLLDVLEEKIHSHRLDICYCSNSHCPDIVEFLCEYQKVDKHCAAILYWIYNMSKYCESNRVDVANSHYKVVLYNNNHHTHQQQQKRIKKQNTQYLHRKIRRAGIRAASCGCG